MALVATVALRRGRYDAGGRDDRRAEALPAPFRLFCALVAVAGRTGDPAQHAGLRWLERQPAPDIIRPPILDRGRDDGFFVTNRVESSGGSMFHPGRKNGAKHRAWVSFEGPGFRFVWNDDPPSEIFSALQELARGVTYLGRVESAVSVQLTAEQASPSSADELRFGPVPLGSGHEAAAVPYEGSLDALVDAHDRGASAWEVARWAAYALPAEPGPQALTGPFDSMLVFSIPGQPIDGSNLLDLTAAFRAAVMSRVESVTGHDNLPAPVHGHDGGVEHLAYVGLPFVGSEHAHGNVRGLAVVMPRALDAAVRTMLVEALTGQATPFDRVAYSRARDHTLEIVHDPFPTGPFVLTAERWTGAGRGGARDWVTATPAMLDRYPTRGEPVEAVVARSVVTAGYPTPEWVEVSPSGFVTGAIRYRRGWSQVLGRRPRRPLWHVRLRFPEPVVGPVLFGALRYVGGGLCIPIRSDDRTVEGSTTPEGAMAS